MELLPENYGAYSVVYPNAPRVLVQPKLRTVFVSATEHDSSAGSNQVMETIISLGYILSHYNQKGGANVCIVLGK